MGSVSALELAHDVYRAGETVQAYTNGSFVSSQISLLDNNSQKVVISPLLNAYRSGETLLYFDLDGSLANGTYTLIAGEESVAFTVVQESPAFRVRPALVVLDPSATNFKITLTPAVGSGTVLISSSDAAVVPRKSSLDVSSAKDLYMDYAYTKIHADSVLLLTYGERNYSVRVIYPQSEGVASIPENVSVPSNESVLQLPALVFLASGISETLAPNQSKNGEVHVQNTLDAALLNLSYSLTGNLASIVELNRSSLAVLEGGNISVLGLVLNAERNISAGTYSGTIVLSNADYSAALPVDIIVAAEKSAQSESKPLNFSVSYSSLPTKQESSGIGVYIVGIILVALLLFLISLIALRLREKPEIKFKEYIEATKRR
ncbi:hypothetical protein HZA98_05250 [Candidatus Woesearchaeota archaeon]|nr:hypothetical protein [Candidatus Woesearchaeota archaeon]